MLFYGGDGYLHSFRYLWWGKSFDPAQTDCLRAAVWQSVDGAGDGRKLRSGSCDDVWPRGIIGRIKRIEKPAIFNAHNVCAAESLHRFIVQDPHGESVGVGNLRPVLQPEKPGISFLHKVFGLDLTASQPSGIPSVEILENEDLFREPNVDWSQPCHTDHLSLHLVA